MLHSFLSSIQFTYIWRLYWEGWYLNNSCIMKSCDIKYCWIHFVKSNRMMSKMYKIKQHARLKLFLVVSSNIKNYCCKNALKKDNKKYKDRKHIYVRNILVLLKTFSYKSCMNIFLNWWNFNTKREKKHHCISTLFFECSFNVYMLYWGFSVIQQYCL